MLLNPPKKSFEKENTHLSVHRAQERQGLRRGCKAGQGLPTATSHPFPFSKDVFKVPISVNSLNTAQLKAGFRARQSRWAVASLSAAAARGHEGCRTQRNSGKEAAPEGGGPWPSSEGLCALASGLNLALPPLGAWHSEPLSLPDNAFVSA